jgi:hypothetical protein
MSDAIAAWMPAPLLAMLVIGMGAWIWKNLSRRFDKIEMDLSVLPKLATKDELGNMGNRFDDRVGNLRERVGILEALNK